MPTKLKIKMGHIEFEYEGDAPYGTDAVKELFTHIESLMGAAPAGAFDTPPRSAPNGADLELEDTSDLTSLGIDTVAARLQVKTGSDMAIAAAAHLQICAKKGSFSRKELLTAMQAATGYYTANMRSNLSSTIKQLIGSKRINSLANSQMSLTAVEQSALRTKLAQS